MKSAKKMKKNKFNYWNWFFQGINSDPGYKRIINKWILFHLLIGIVLSFIVELPLKEIANKVLIPLSGLFIGLSFGWIGNSILLLQNKKVNSILKKREGGFIEYPYAFQTAVLMVFISIICWGIVGMEVVDTIIYIETISYFYFKIILFTMSSMTIRECWHVVLGVQFMLILNDN